MNTVQNFFIKIALALKSKTCWTIASLLVVQLPQIKSQIPVEYQGWIDIALAALGIYFRMNPSEPLNDQIKSLTE